ncbi:MAG: cation transporter [Fimbriimonadaceae bacterium]|nr:cation transporter [Fimbriimonadaceae bacterium]
MRATDSGADQTLRRTAWLAVAVALGIVVLRLLAWSQSRSLAVLADSIDPLFNLIAASVTAAGVVAARRPADEDHPFGHRKLEFVAVGVHGATVLSGIITVAVAAVWQWVAQTPLQVTTPALLLFGVSLLLNAYQGHLLLHTGRRYDSPALRAAGRHARLDVWLGGAVAVNLLASTSPRWWWLDPLVSVVVIAVLAVGALRLMRRALLGLLDTAAPEVVEAAQRAIGTVQAPELVGYHDLRIRDAGGVHFVDFHVQFADGCSLERAHEIATRIEDAIEDAVGAGDAIAHLEPDTEVRADRAHGAPPLSARERARRRAANISLLVAVLLVAVKMAAWYVTRSTAVLSDALESLINIVAAGFAVVSVRLARSGTDPDHQYGHHKVEFLAAAFEGVLIQLAALGILATAVPRLLTPRAVGSLDLGLALLVAAALVNGVLGWYLIRCGRQLNSLTLEADGRHVLSDVYTSAGVLLGLLVVAATGWQRLDPLVALVLALLLGRTGAALVRRSLSGVMDTVDRDTLDRAAAALEQCLGEGPLLSWHKLRLRDAGAMRFVDVHVQFREGVSLAVAHREGHRLEAALELALEPASVIVHAEPASAVL